MIFILRLSGEGESLTVDFCLKVYTGVMGEGVGQFYLALAPFNPHGRKPYRNLPATLSKDSA